MSAPFAPAPVEVRTSPVHGRGLFASGPIPAGTCLGVYPLLILSPAETDCIRQTRLYHYVFHVDEDPQGRVRVAVAFGEISMCNHSAHANAIFKVDAAAQTVTLTASRDLCEDEEILIDYEEFASETI